MRTIGRACAATVGMGLLASVVGAQTTGRLQGTVLDSAGAVLPGVTVTATSDNLQGSKVTVTDATGAFRLLALPPGEYLVRVELDGFNTLEQPGVKVGIDRTVTLEMALEAAFVGEITVSGTAPVVDVSSSSSGLNVTGEMFERLALARDFYQVAQLATGTGNQFDNISVDDLNDPQDDVGALGPTVGGSTGAENGYVIDGLNTTGVEKGGTAKSLNFEFIEEVEIKTGGLPAEYGRMSGGVINAITKSGGNELTGDVFGYFTGGDLQTDSKIASDLPVDTTTVLENDGENDVGFDLGGYFIKDRLWYFAAYDRLETDYLATVIRPLEAPGSPAVGSEIGTTVSRDLYAGKLTYRLGASHNLQASLFGDPGEREGNVFLIEGPRSTWEGTLESGSDDYVLRYDGVYGGSWVLEALAGRHQEEYVTAGAGKAIPRIIDNTLEIPADSGGFGSHQDQEFGRDVVKLDLSKFVGEHELKVGVDREWLTARQDNWNGGAGQRMYLFSLSDGRTAVRHRFYVDDTAPGFDRDDPATWRLLAPLTVEPESTNTAVYAQDSWRLLPNLTLNLGLRLERQEIADRFGETIIDLDDEWAPRLGIIWDLTGNGRSRLYANAGRFYETVPMDMNIRAFGGELTCFCYNFSQDPNDLFPDPAFNSGGIDGLRTRLTGGTTPADPGLEGQYIDELLLGYEQEILPNLAFRVQGTYRELGQAIEDFLTASGQYFIANPGSGIGSGMTFFDYSTAPAPEARREYTAVEVELRKRYADNWQLITSYVWSKLEGNYDGVFQVSTGQLDPNINSAFDYADFLVNADGYLSNDRRHQVKMIGSYTLGSGLLQGLNVGMTAWWKSGLPLNAYGYSAGYSNNEYYLVPRGSLGRGPSSYEADLHLGYPLRLGDRFELNLLLDVFNLLDRQSKVLLDERYNRDQDPICSGYEAVCNEDGGVGHVPGTTTPVGSIPDPRATSPNPDYLKKGLGFTQPRSIRVGLRLSF